MTYATQNVQCMVVKVYTHMQELSQYAEADAHLVVHTLHIDPAHQALRKTDGYISTWKVNIHLCGRPHCSVDM